MKNYHIASDWSINSQHYLQHGKEYLCTSQLQSTTSPVVHCASTVCIAARSVVIIPVKLPVVLSDKKIHHLVSSDSVPEGLIPLDISHRVNHKYPKNLLIPVLNTTMEKVSMRKYSILGLNPLSIDNCEINEI